MKRSLVIVLPIVLLILVNACNLTSNTLPQYSPEQWTAIAVTQQAMGQPGGDRIKSWLNAVPTDYTNITALEENLVGKYEVLSVQFPNENNYFEVDINCECKSGSACCLPERMFVYAIQKMYYPQQTRDQVLAAIPSNVKFLDVVCRDHTIAFMAGYAPWETVKGFLIGQLSASELSSQVTWRKMN
jgi:hypothetical protein